MGFWLFRRMSVQGDRCRASGHLLGQQRASCVTVTYPQSCGPPRPMFLPSVGGGLGLSRLGRPPRWPSAAGAPSTGPRDKAAEQTFSFSKHVAPIRQLL